MAITTRSSILSNIAVGNGYTATMTTKGTSGITSAAFSSGSITIQPTWNVFGTTYMSTLVSLPIPAGLSNELFLNYFGVCGNGANEGGFLVRAYLMGTVDFTATGDRFTADASVTYPLTRKVYGAATQTINLVPMISVSTATATTAPQFILKTAAGGTGYVNQSGGNVVGTKTFIFPAAATALLSSFILRLEEGDSAVQSIAAINVTTAGTAGVAQVYGLEYLAPGANPLATANGSIVDTVSGCLLMTDLKPALPTAGTLTSYLIYVCCNSTNHSVGIHLGAVHNV